MNILNEEESRRIPSLKNDLEILSTLAEHEELSQYDLSKITRIDYATVLRHLRTLGKERNEYVTFLREEASERGGKDKKIFTITKEGLLYLLIFDDVYERIDRIADAHPDLWPLVLGKWQHICRTGNKKRAIHNLKYVFSEFLGILKTELMMTANTRNLFEEARRRSDPLDFFTVTFYTRNIDEDLADEKWAEMLTGDQEIMKYVQSKVDLMKKNIDKDLERWNRIKNRLQELSSQKQP